MLSLLLLWSLAPALARREETGWDEDEEEEEEGGEEGGEEDEEDLDDLDLDFDLDEEEPRKEKRKKPPARQAPAREQEPAPLDLDEDPAGDPGADPVYRWGASLGLGGSFLIGGNGPAYAPGFSQQIAFEYRLSRLSWFSFGFGHSAHVLQDSSVYFPDHSVTPRVLIGAAALNDPEVGFRIGFALRGLPDSGVRGWPFLRLGLGADFSTTRILIPSFSGQMDYMSYGVAPFLSAGFGAELRFNPRMSLVPEVRMWIMGYEDGSESGGAGRWGTETRVAPTLAFNLLF